MAAGYHGFVANEVPSNSTLNDYLSKQVVGTYSTTSDRDTQTSSPKREGMPAVVTGDDDFQIYDGSAWQKVGWYSASGRTGFTITAATQSIPNNVLTNITYNTEVFDPDGFFPGSGITATVPTGADGLYQMTLRVGITTSTNGAIEIQAGGNNYDVSFTSTSTILSPTLTICIPLAATNTIVTNVLQILGSAQNVSARLDCFRIGR